jgi:carboxyl-terminal processing protease
MKPSRTLLLAASAILVLFLVGGGLAVKVGASENSYSRVVLFSEILGLVMDNYVDPVEADELLRGAYEGMLGGLDANSAYLSPGEVADWKAHGDKPLAGPGFTVLKSRRTLQVVAVEPGSSAEEAGVEVGDHIRTIDGEAPNDLSLRQARNRLSGDVGSTVKVGVLRPSDGFAREEFSLVRSMPGNNAYSLDVERGIAVLRFSGTEIDVDALAGELEEVRSRGVEKLLIDLRNRAESGPREVAPIVSLFQGGELLKLRNRSGDVLETLASGREKSGWSGEIALLVNYATAGGAEAIARVIQEKREATVYGESTFGLGSEPKLVELDNGSGVLVSYALWETASGEGWNDDGLTPDQVVEGDGEDFAEVEASQLERVLDILTGKEEEAEAAEAA